MKILTNKYLKETTENPKEELYKEFVFESPELNKVDEEMGRYAEQEGLKLILKKKEKLQKIYDKFNSDTEKEIVIKLAVYYSYLNIFSKSELRAQRNKCRALLKTDVCKRNVVLYNELLMEEEKLNSSINTKQERLMCTFLDYQYTKINQDWGEIDRYVRISEIMNVIIDFPYFYTEEDAETHIKSHTKYKSARKFIYDKIKKKVIK